MLSDLHVVPAGFTNINRLQLYIDLVRSYSTFMLVSSLHLSLVSLPVRSAEIG